MTVPTMGSAEKLRSTFRRKSTQHVGASSATSASSETSSETLLDVNTETGMCEDVVTITWCHRDVWSGVDRPLVALRRTSSSKFDYLFVSEKS